MNLKQRESAAKYLYDLSKGVLLTGGAGLFTEKISTLAFAGHIAIAFYTFVVAHWLEDDQ